MNILKVINNNVVSALDKHNHEIIVMGKGVGFQKKPQDVINESQIEKIFRLPKENLTHFEELLAEIPYEHIQIADEAIMYASQKLGKELNRNIYITLTDHLSFSIERQKKGVTLQNALLWEIKKYYPLEFHIGCDILGMVDEKLGMKLPEDEAGFLAIHIVNAELSGNGNMGETQQMPSTIKDIINIVTYTYQMQLDEGSIAYERFLTHLKFFLQRCINREVYEEDDEELSNMMRERYPNAHACALKIAKYMKDNKGYDVPTTEISYLATHIARITKK